MRVVRSLSMVLLVLVLAPRAFAQVSCANPDNLCTGDPCTTTNIAVQSPCVVDFGARALVIGGTLDVPSGGTLSLTAATILVQGRIESPGTAVTLVANAGGADLRTEIDVGAGSIDVSATGNIDVKNRLKAKQGGSITLAADGMLATGVAAVLEAQAGSVALAGDSGVTIGGRVFVEGVPSGTIQIDSSAGTVTLDKDLRVRDGSATVNGATGVVVNDAIFAAGGTSSPGGTVALTSATGNVAINDKIRVTGSVAGSIVVNAPLGSVEPRALDAKGKIDGGSVSIAAATISIRKGIDAEGGTGNGGNITLAASTTLMLDGGDLDAHGKVNGGTIGLLGDVASGDVTVDGSSLNALGSTGNGGLLVISAPAGAVSLFTRANLTGKGGMGGQVNVDGVAITVLTKSRFDADGGTLGGELHFDQSGPGLLQLRAVLEARDDGVIEASAPAGNLLAGGNFRVGPAGCMGLSAGGVVDTSGLSADVPLTPTCP